MGTIKLLDENENRIKQRERILGWIKKAIDDKTSKSYDHFIETFPEKARYKIISKSILIDTICDLVIWLLEAKESARQINPSKQPTINPLSALPRHNLKRKS